MSGGKASSGVRAFPLSRQKLAPFPDQRYLVAAPRSFLNTALRGIELLPDPDRRDRGARERFRRVPCSPARGRSSSHLFRYRAGELRDRADRVVRVLPRALRTVDPISIAIGGARANFRLRQKYVHRQ